MTFNATVINIQGNSVTSGAPTKGQFFMATSSSNYGPVTLSGDLSESSATAGLITVTGLQGNSVPSPSGTNTVLTWSGSALSWAAGGGGSGITALTGDVTASGTGSVAATAVSLTGGSFGSGTGVVAIAAASAAPTSNPGTGGYLYETSGALTHRGTGSAIVTVAPPGTGTVNSQAGFINRVVAFLETTSNSSSTFTAYTYSFPSSNAVAFFKVAWTAKVTTGTGTLNNSQAGETWAAYVTVAATPHVLGNNSSTAQKSNFVSSFPLNNPQFDILSLSEAGAALGNAITTAVIITATGSQIQINVTPPFATSVTIDWLLDIYIQGN